MASQVFARFSNLPSDGRLSGFKGFIIHKHSRQMSGWASHKIWSDVIPYKMNIFMENRKSWFTENTLGVKIGSPWASYCPRLSWSAERTWVSWCPPWPPRSPWVGPPRYSPGTAATPLTSIFRTCEYWHILTPGQRRKYNNNYIYRWYPPFLTWVN